MTKISLKLPRKYLKEIIILFAGVALILLSNLVLDTQGEKHHDENKITLQQDNKLNNDTKNASEYFTEYYAKQIKDFVSKIDGVSNVSVIVHIDSTDNVILAENSTNESEKITEKDSNGGMRDTVSDKQTGEYVVIKDADGNEEIVILCNKMPVITGVAVRADGAESYVVQEKIINAIKNVYGLNASDIYVCS